MTGKQKAMEAIKALTKNGVGPIQAEVAEYIGKERRYVGQLIRDLIDEDKIKMTQKKELRIKKYYVRPKRLTIKIKK